MQEGIEKRFNEKFQVVPFKEGEDYQSEYPRPEEVRQFILEEVARARREAVIEYDAKVFPNDVDSFYRRRENAFKAISPEGEGR